MSMDSKVAALSLRRFPRLVLDGPLSVRVLALDSVMDVHDIGLGGVNTSSSLPLEPGATHTFEFVLRGAGALHLKARIVYCRAEKRAFSIGWAWETDGTTQQNVRALLDYLTDVRNVCHDI